MKTYVTLGFTIGGANDFSQMVCSVTENNEVKFRQDDDDIYLSVSGARLLLENLEVVINSIREN